MRLFIAIDFSDETKDRLYEFVCTLRRDASHGRFVARSNMHLTLAFLGECDGAQRSYAQDALDTIDFDPFDLHISGLGTFKGGTWWAGADLSPELDGLHGTLVKAIKTRGFNIEDRKFKPHITLGRQITLRHGKLSGDTLATSVDIYEHVDKISLMLSERKDGRMVYTPLYES